MFKVVQINGLACPFILCKVCGGHIDNVKLGLVLWEAPEDEAAGSDAIFVHKHACDWEITETIRQRGKPPFSMELSQFLVYTLRNSGLPPAAFAVAAVNAAEASM